eukprot:337544_1
MYQWMVIVGSIFCAAMAWGIGANDVANFFGPAVGARSITLKRAMVIAFIFEFIGAFFMGKTVTNTIRKKIVGFDQYDGEADILMLGMFSALTAASLWVYLATKYSLPVSTTQSIVGAIIGFVLVSKGPTAVAWDAVIDIIIFWIATPVMGCAACFLFYIPTRFFILKKDNSYKISLNAYPLFVFIVIFIMLTFLLFKGFKRIEELGDWAEESPGFVILIGMASGMFFAFIAYLVLIRTGIVQRYAERKVPPANDELGEIKVERVVTRSELHVLTPKTPTADDEAGQRTATGDEEGPQTDANTINKSMKEDEAAGHKFIAVGHKLKSGLEVDIFDDLTKEESDLEKFSTKFDAKTERLFEWLSVLAATFGIFAHGSNDIANAVAPFASIVALSQQAASDPIHDKNDVSMWILFVASLFMSIGCVTYGYNVIKTLGVKLAKLSPSRGYFTQVAAATVIIFASNYGFPASTTHAQVGATIAVGVTEKIYNKELKWNQVFNWRLLMHVFFGWIATIVISGCTSALIFSLMAYSPCVSP